MKEQLVTLETAKLAKSKGYVNNLDQMNDWYEPNLMSYIPRRDNGEFHPIGAFFYDSNQNIQQYQTGQSIDAPTQSSLQSWLRDNHDISVEPYYWGGVFNVRVINFNNKILFDNARGETDDYIPGYKGWDEYEEALEVGLEKALNLI